MSTVTAERPSLTPDIESAGAAGHAKKKRGPKPKQVVEFPDAVEGEWVDLIPACRWQTHEEKGGVRGTCWQSTTILGSN